MEKLIIVRYGEIGLKGDNKRFFEDKLQKHVRIAVSDLGKPRVYREHSRVYVEARDGNENEIVDRIRKVFGVVSISITSKLEANMDIIKENVLKEIEDNRAKRTIKTFKIQTKRADKTFPMESLEVNRKIGGYVLDKYDDLLVDVHNPDILIYVEIRNCAFVYSEKIPGFGGLPLGSNGKAMVLLSGGIDSPVAAWLVGKRGVEIAAIHFHSYPFTSDRAKEKVVELSKILSRYFGRFKLYSINLLPIQKEINEKCPEEEMTILARRFMMKIAERVGLDKGCEALVTGENIGQVASQTIQGLNATNNAVQMPVFRPLITMDKMEIVNLAKKLDTYETSILPYEDCCTVFLPKHPVTKPKLEKILYSEEKLDVEKLINEAIESMETEDIYIDEV